MQPVNPFQTPPRRPIPQLPPILRRGPSRGRAPNNPANAQRIAEAYNRAIAGSKRPRGGSPTPPSTPNTHPLTTRRT